MPSLTIDPAEIRSLAAAIADGVTTPELLHQWLDNAALVDDILIPYADEWQANDGNAEITVDTDSGFEAAEEYVRDGDWGDCASTTWITVRVWQNGIDADGDIVAVNEECHTVTIEPEEPPCIDDAGHDWQSPHNILGGLKENPGVWGHAGGVIINEVCLRCGCGRTTDTWAQNPENGQQGLTSVEYEPGKFADEIADLAAA